MTLRRRAEIRKTSGLVIVSAFFLIWSVLVRVQAANDFPGSLPELAGSTVNELCAPLVALAIVLSLRSRDVQVIVAVVCGSLLAVSLVLYGLGGGEAQDLRYDGRFSGVLLHPNSLATIAVIALVAAAQLSSRKAVAWLACPALLCLYLADSRAGLLSAAATLVIWHLTGRRRHFVTIALLVTLPLAATAAASGWTYLIERRTSSVESREYIWTFILENPDAYLPWGIGSMGIFDWAQRGIFPEPYFHAHNQFLTWIVAGGVVGVAMSVAWLAAGAVASTKSRAAAIAFVGLFPLFMVESPLQTGTANTLQIPALMCWLVIGSALTSVGPRETTRAPGTGGRRRDQTVPTSRST